MGEIDRKVNEIKYALGYMGLDDDSIYDVIELVNDLVDYCVVYGADSTQDWGDDYD